jgi:hypothetical protein
MANQLYDIAFGLTLQAYGTTEIAADSMDELREKVDSFLADGAGDEDVEVNWDTPSDYRVVHIKDARGDQVELPAGADAMLQADESALLAKISDLTSTLRAIRLDCQRFLDGTSPATAEGLLKCVINTIEEAIGPKESPEDF